MIESKKQVILRKRASGVGVVMLDSPGKVNLLTTDVMHELEDTLSEAGADDSIKALVLMSGKHDTFLSGADLHEILRFENRDAAYSLAKRGQALLNQLSNLGKPVVVGINGSCLGGGLELAMACNRRIATTSDTTLLGLPEVRLGLIPGLGGTQRLPRLVGVKAALEIILSSEPVDTMRAKEMGLIDDIVLPEQLMNRLEQEALALLEAKEIGARFEYDASANPKDPQLLNMAERSVRIKTRGHYPAHTAAIRVTRQGLEQGMEAGLEAEANNFADLAVSHIARNLIFLFFTSEFAGQSAAAQAAKAGVPRVETVGIIGGGPMGIGIAQQAASTGHKVLLSDISPQQAEAAVEQVRSRLLQQRGSVRGVAATPEQQAENVKAVGETSELAGADLIVEAVFEDTEVKAKVFNQVAEKIGEHAALATNTSSLSVSGIAQKVKKKENVVGLHFFHPVDKMPLVEVVSLDGVSRAVMARTLSFASALGKIPISVKDGPGFLVNRLLCCYLAEAGKLAQERVPLNWIDDVATTMGMPMGPLALLDEVGLDIAYKVSHVLNQQFGERLAPPAVFKIVESLGLVGKKQGEGIYLWDDGRRKEFNPRLIEAAALVVTDDRPDVHQASDIWDRLIVPMIDEAARCLDEKIVRRARELDMAMVMGTGFPAFRGGPLRYADTLTIGHVILKLEAMQEKTGRTPCDLLRQMNASGRSFYSSGRED